MAGRSARLAFSEHPLEHVHALAQCRQLGGGESSERGSQGLEPFRSPSTEGAGAGRRSSDAHRPRVVGVVLAERQSVANEPVHQLGHRGRLDLLDPRELSDALQRRGVDVKFAIHPVAGRMPGHMNVLLAEADVPYDQLFDLEQINSEFPQTDVVLIVGANDVVNPAARSDTTSPIYGMPILEVEAASSIIVVKRSMRSGFAGLDNDLFYLDKTQMLFGDAKAAIGQVVDELSRLPAKEAAG